MNDPNEGMGLIAYIVFGSIAAMIALIVWVIAHGY